MPAASSPRRRAASLALVAALGLAAAPVLDERGPPALRRAKRELLHHRVQSARGAVLTYLRRNPGDPEGYAVLASVESQAGWAPEALAVEPWGEGTAWYGELGQNHHADALRDVGRPAEAAALRAAFLRDAAEEAIGADVAADRVADLRALGDPQAAEDALWEGLARWPRATVLLAAAADLAMDAGALEDARSWLLLADQRGGVVPRSRLAAARLARLEGDPEAALAIVAALAHRRPRSPEVRALQAQLLCDLGEPGDALDLLEREALAALGHVDLEVARGRALWLLGEPAAARDLARWLVARHPGQADVGALVRLVAE